jgi:2-dehydro-3-deoxyphosphooctonate aldolase (KDO 8-P synthase)
MSPSEASRIMDPDLQTFSTRPIQVSSETIGGGHPLVLLAGPGAIETERQASSLAEKLVEAARDADVPFIWTASVERAHPTFGFADGLEVLRGIRQRLAVPVATEVYEIDQVGAAAEVVDLLQIPGDLSRRVELVVEAARTGKPVNIVKGPRLSTEDSLHLVEQATGAGNWNVILTERGTSIGDDERLVVDFRGFAAMRESGFPLIFDASRSLRDGASERPFSEALALASVAVGVDGVLLIVHEDGGSATGSFDSCPLSLLPKLLRRLKRIEPSQETL